MFQNHPNGEVVSDGKEYNMNSPFVEDTKKKFWMNLYNGKFQCFASHKTGNFPYFISQTTHKDYRSVEADLLFKTLLLPDTVKDPEPERCFILKEIPQEILDTFVPVDENCPSEEAVALLMDRNLICLDDSLSNTFFYCTSGLYQDRLIIPYYTGEKMFYFQARALSPDQPLKYLNFKGSKSSHVLYPYDERWETLAITEGALDARSLQLHGINATSTLSCSVSRIQLEDFDTLMLT